MANRFRLPALPSYDGPIPRPRLLGFLAGILVPLILLLIAHAAFQIDLGSDGPTSWGYLEEE